MRQRTPNSGASETLTAIAQERDRVRAFKAARRHTWLVRLLRIALPVVGTVAFGAFAARLALDSYLRPKGIEVGGTRIDTKNLTMETPRYEGFGKDGSRYRVRAREAITDLKRTGPVRLIDIDGTLTQLTGVVTNLKAVWGTYDEKTEVLELYEKIDIDGSTGMKARLTRATVYNKESRVVSDEAIWAQNETGTITAKSMVLRQKEHKAAFRTSVHVTMRPAQSSANQSAGNLSAGKTNPDGLRGSEDPAEATKAGKPKGAKSTRAASPLPGLTGNSGQPIEVRSDTLDVDDDIKLAQFRRDVIARQGDATLEAPELDVTYEGKTALSGGEGQAAPAAAGKGADGKGPDDGTTKLKTVKARGGVTTRNKDDTAVGATLDYDAATETAVMTGDVVLTSTGDRRATADRAEFDQRTERAVLIGNVVLTSGAERRVTGDRAEFDQKADTGLVTGTEVVATQGRNVLRGRRLALDRKAGTTRLDSPPPAQGQPAGRITTVFYQEQKPGAEGKPAKAKPAQPTNDGNPLAMSFKTNPDAPIEVEADSLDVFDLKKQAVFKGKVVAKQGDFVVHTIEMTAHYTGQAGLNSVGAPGQAPAQPKAKGEPGSEPAQLTRIEARQRVLVVSKDGREVIGDWADHDVKSNTITVGGKVIVSDGKSTVNGPPGSRLLIDMTTGKSTFEQPEGATAGPGQSEPAVSASGPIGPGAGQVTALPCPAGAVCTKERFSVVLYPKEVQGKAKEKVEEFTKDGWATAAQKEVEEKKKKIKKQKPAADSSWSSSASPSDGKQ